MKIVPEFRFAFNDAAVPISGSHLGYNLAYGGCGRAGLFVAEDRLAISADRPKVVRRRSEPSLRRRELTEAAALPAGNAGSLPRPALVNLPVLVKGVLQIAELLG